MPNLEGRWEARRQERLEAEREFGDRVPIAGFGSAIIAVVLMFLNWIFDGSTGDEDRRRDGE